MHLAQTTETELSVSRNLRLRRAGSKRGRPLGISRSDHSLSSGFPASLIAFLFQHAAESRTISRADPHICAESDVSTAELESMSRPPGPPWLARDLARRINKLVN